MKLRLSKSFVLAFLSLTFLMHEAHELVHTWTGRIICGCWGVRDFNSWGLCDGCAEQHSLAGLSTIAGPLFTFIMIWIGAMLIRPRCTTKQKAIGFSLIFSNLPFARILTAALGGGDEVWALKAQFDNQQLAWITGLAIIVIVLIVPLLNAYRLIANKRKMAWFLLFLIAPIIVDVVVVLVIMNSLLMKGIMNTNWILGSPMLVTAWTIFVLALFTLTRKNLYKLAAE